MGASDLFEKLSSAGVRLSLVGPDKLAAEPECALTEDLRQLIRENKALLIQALAPVARGIELRRRRVTAELDRHFEAMRWAIFDPDSDPASVICTVAVRGVCTCELRIPRDRYDPWTVLDALQKTH